MPRCVAFLRAVNVGGRTVKMAELRELVEGLGLANVATFIASGNVLFDSRAAAASLEKKLEAAFESNYGWPVETFIRSPAELERALREAPDAGDAHSVQVGFLKAKPDAAARTALRKLETPAFGFAFGEREYYFIARERIGAIRLTPKQIERALGAPSTMRNVNTIVRILATL